jgi:hypothetical protein
MAIWKSPLAVFRTGRYCNQTREVETAKAGGLFIYRMYGMSRLQPNRKYEPVLLGFLHQHRQRAYIPVGHVQGRSLPVNITLKAYFLSGVLSS